MGEEARPRKKGGVLGIFRDIVYGMSSHEMTLHALRTRASMEHLFILITMGDLLGVPILPPYYSLRLLPHVTPLLDDPSALVRAMAVWAYRRLATPDAVATARKRYEPAETDSEVRKEWAKTSA